MKREDEMTLIKGGRFKPTKYDKKKFSDNYDNIFKKKAITPPSSPVPVVDSENESFNIYITFNELKAILEPYNVDLESIRNILLERAN